MGTSPEPMRPAHALEGMLSIARARVRRAAALEGLVVAIGGVALAGAIGIGAAALGLVGWPLALLELGAIGAAIGYAAARYGWILPRGLREPAELAGWIDDALEGPEAAREDAARPTAVRFRTAVELGRDRGLYGESAELADHARRAADERAAQLDVGQLVAERVKPSLRPRLAAAGAALALCALLAALLPASRDLAWGVLAALGALEDPITPSLPEPRFDDVRLSFRYPAYTQRAPVTQITPDGRVRALPGTEVVIETNASERLVEATLVLQHGEEESSRTAAEVDGRRVRASFIVGRAGRYRFRVRTEGGQTLEERRGRPIELELDLPPSVAMYEPKTTPLEVNEADRVAMEVEASDDFAMGEARVAWRVMGTTREGRSPLELGTRGERKRREKASFDLSGLQLRPGDRVAYSVEVLDNDTINGPKVGASETKELRVYSKEAHHREVLAKAEKALDELIHILGDDLETPVEPAAEPAAYDALLTKAAAIVERARAANALLKDAVTALQKDPLGQKPIATAFESARRDLARGTRAKGIALDDARAHVTRTQKPDERRARGLAGRQAEVVADLEKNVVYLADLLNDQRLLDAEALTKALRAEQQNLRAALEAFKAAPTDEQRKLLMQAIGDIKKRIQEITAELSQLKGSIPTDLMNPDALDERDQLADMDKVQRMIEEGDLEGAMKQLEKMLTGTERMLSEMQQGREELGSREYSEVTEKARQMWKDLETLEAEQSALGKSIDGYAQKMLDRMKDRLGDADGFVAKQKARLEAALAQLGRAEPTLKLAEGDGFDIAERRVADALRAIEAKDFGAARESAEDASGELRRVSGDAERRTDQARRYGDLFGSADDVERAAHHVEEATGQVDQVLKDLEALLPSPEEMMSKQERGEMQRLSEKQQGLRQRSQQIKKQLDELAEQVPIVGEGTRELLDEAAQGMTESGQGLGGGDAPGAMGGHQKAMDALGRLKDALEQMSKGGGGQGGGGVPLPFGPGGESGAEDGSEGTDPRSKEKVEIPKPEQFKAPAEFREDILKAAKQGAAEAYKDAVRRYYEEIVK